MPLKRNFRIKLVVSIGLSLWFATSTIDFVRAQDPSVTVSLNNDGVRALIKTDYSKAIEKFEAALKLDGTYKLARSNLSIAYNNYGLQQRSKPDVAIKFFHKALMLDPDNRTTRANVGGIIRMMGLDPESFKDRVELGDKAAKEKDYTGAIVEYAAALDLQDSAQVHEKLGDIYCIVDRKEKAIEQFKASLSMKYSFMLDQKLRLLRAVGEVPRGITPSESPNAERGFRSLSLNSPMIALVAFPLLAMLLAFVTRRKRISIWLVGLAIASIFAIAGFFAL